MSPQRAGKLMFPANGSGNVAGFFVQAVLQVLRSEGVLSSARAPALGEPSEFAVPEAEFRALLRSLEGQGALGLRIGERITEPNLHAAGVLLTVSRTLQDAYKNCMSLMEPMQSAPSGVLELHGEQASYVLHPSDLGALWEDLQISMCFHMARRFLLGTQSANHDFAIHVELARPRPADASEYERCFDGRVRFDAPVTKLTFPRALLDLPRPGVASALAADMRHVLLRRITPAPASALWTERVESVLRERSGLAEVDFERLAQRWSLSLRTLRRRLADEGTTLSELLDRVRFERARYFLEQTDAAHGEIAEALGYADETSFRRAFKRWSGESPSDHRRVAAADR